MLTIAVAGASGFLGGIFARSLESEGHVVRRIGRASSRGTSFTWDLDAGRLDPAALDGADAVVNFVGANISQRWTREHKRAILTTRVRSTELLAKTMVAVRAPPRVFLSTSAIHFYGVATSGPVDESTPPGSGFLAGVVREWEEAAAPVRAAAIRLVYPRLAPVLHPGGGMLAKLLPIFKAGGGGKIGRGTQWMSWVAAHDMVRALRFLMNEESLSGPANICSPNPVTNAEFSRMLGEVLHRPALTTAPEFAVKLMFGEMGEEMLLAGLRAVPRRLLDAGFAFDYPDLASALRHELGR